MTRLAITSIVLGSAMVAGRLPGLLATEKFRRMALAFPRHVWWGRILSAVVALWTGIVMFGAATEDWAWARPFIILGVPVAYGLVIQFGNQFLAVRAGAALMLLVAKVMLDASDASELTSRLVVAVVAYLWVVTAIWMTIAPYQLRAWLGWIMANNVRCRIICALGVAIGLLLFTLGVFAYRIEG